jgi:hypothetical protein
MPQGCQHRSWRWYAHAPSQRTDESNRTDSSIGALLGHIGRVDDRTISEVVRLHGDYQPRADELTLARIARARDDAARQLTRTRDLAAWQATMSRLDDEEALARVPVERQRLSPPEIVDYLRALTRLWADAGPDGRQALVGAIFAKLDVLGFQSLEYDLTPDAIDLGLDVALPALMQLDYQIGEFGRGERSCASMSDDRQTVRFVRAGRGRAEGQIA